MARESRIPRPAGGRFIQVHAWAIKAVGFAAAAVLGELDFLDRAQELPGQILASRARIVADLEGMVGRNAVHDALRLLVSKGWAGLHLLTLTGEKNITTTHHYSLNAGAIAEFLAHPNREARNPKTGKPEIPKPGSQKSRYRDRNRDAPSEGERAENHCAAMDSGDPTDSGGGDKKENVVVVNTTTTTPTQTPTPETTNPTPPCAGEVEPLPSVDEGGGTAEEPVEDDLELEDNIKHLAAEILPLLNNLDQATQQNLLDELSGGVAAGKISSPPSWMWSMVQKARGEKEGGFTPSRALDVQKAREGRREAAARKKQVEAAVAEKAAAEAQEREQVLKKMGLGGEQVRSPDDWRRAMGIRR